MSKVYLNGKEITVAYLNGQKIFGYLNGEKVFDTFDPLYTVNLVQRTGGTINASPMEGHTGDTVTLSNTTNSEYIFDGYSITGSSIYDGNYFDFANSDVTVAGNFRRKVYTLTIKNDGHGTISASKTTGYAGDTVTLSNKYNTYYRFKDYTVTGGTITSNTFKFGSSNATVQANFKVNNFYVSGRFDHAITTSGNRSVKHDFYAYKTYTSGNASIPSSFFSSKTTYISGNKAGNITKTTSNVWTPSGTISGYAWSGYCDSDANQKYALSKNYLTTRTHSLQVNSTNFGTTGGTVDGITKTTTKLTNYGKTTTVGYVHNVANLTTTGSYDYWTTNYSYTTANSLWWASGYLP